MDKNLKIEEKLFLNVSELHLNIVLGLIFLFMYCYIVIILIVEYIGNVFMVGVGGSMCSLFIT